MELEALFLDAESCTMCGLVNDCGHECPVPYHPAVAHMMESLISEAPTWRPSAREAARIRLGLA